MSLVRLQFSGNTMPLVMHNGRLADQLNPLAKRLKSLAAKRKKSDDDLMEIQRVEWEGGLYYDPKIGPYVPAEARRTAQGFDQQHPGAAHPSPVIWSAHSRSPLGRPGLP